MELISPFPDLMGAIDAAINKPAQVLQEYLSFSEKVKENVKELKILHKQRAAMQTEYQKELYLLEFKYAKLYATTYQLQKNIVSEPNMNKSAENLSTKEVGDTVLKDKMNYGNVSTERGIDHYWLRIFLNCPILCQLISEEDVKILKYLIDIKCSYSKKLTSPGFRLLFVFRNNPYFKSNILMKQFSLAFFNPSEYLNEYGPFKISTSKATEINWSTKMRSDIESKTSGLSFFEMFRTINPPCTNSPEFEMLTDDYDLCVYIRDRILPYSVYWYTGEILSSKDT